MVRMGRMDAVVLLVKRVALELLVLRVLPVLPGMVARLVQVVPGEKPDLKVRLVLKESQVLQVRLD